MVFPTWRYHKTKEALIVHSQEQLDALGPGWLDHPHAESDAPAEKPALPAKDGRTEDELIVEIQAKGLSTLAKSTLKRRTKLQLLEILNGAE